MFAFALSFSTLTDINSLKEPSSDAKKARAFVESCLASSLSDGISDVAQHGGYYVVPEPKTIVYLFHQIPFYFKNATLHVPTKKEVEEQLGAYVSDRLKYCIESYNGISSHDLAVSIAIYDDAIKATTSGSIEISNQKKTTRLSGFQAQKNSQFGMVYNAVLEILEIQKRYPTEICLTCAYTIATEKGLAISVVLIGNKTALFTILDNQINPTVNYMFLYEVVK
ncbi:MAG: hypothetical protein QXK37_01545 [Candidatus Woesearchaeota archaeon]